MIRPWQPSDPGRWAELNLADPDPSGALPKGATIADVLAWALVIPGATDPIEGIVDSVTIELKALADLLPDRRTAAVLLLLGKRLDAAMLLLKWIDNRERMPREPGEEEDEGGATDAAPPFDPEATQDAPPSDRGIK